VDGSFNLSHECGNWERGRAGTFLGIHKSDLLCSEGGGGWVGRLLLLFFINFWRFFIEFVGLIPHWKFTRKRETSLLFSTLLLSEGFGRESNQRPTLAESRHLSGICGRHANHSVQCTEYTELQPLLSGVHSVMRVKSVLAGEGGGSRPPPLITFTPHQ
jgi:hypothetical protein